MKGAVAFTTLKKERRGERNEKPVKCEKTICPGGEESDPQWDGDKKRLQHYKEILLKLRQNFCAQEFALKKR